jgi:hypothetical protein
MSKSLGVCLAALLVWASAVPGQDVSDLPNPKPMKDVPVPATAHPGGPLEAASPCCEPELVLSSQFTADLDYVLWFISNPENNVRLSSTAPLGTPAATILGTLGDPQTDSGGISGARLTLGWWQVEENNWIKGGIRDLGAEASFFVVGQRGLGVQNLTNPTIVRPFFDLNNGQQSGFIVATPGLAVGNISANAQDTIWGAEANCWKNVYFDYPGTSCCVNLLAGFRFLDLDGRLEIQSESQFAQNLAAFPQFAGFAGNSLQVSDSFTTYNHFYGGQIGVSGRWYFYDHMNFETDLKIAVGMTTEDVEIAGSQLRTLANQTQIASPAGLLALPSNIGSHNTDRFAYVPEVDIKLLFPICQRLTLSMAFSALYWSRLARPVEQIDRDLDITQIPNFPPGVGAPPTSLHGPLVPFRQSDLLLLGANFGLDFSW